MPVQYSFTTRWQVSAPIREVWQAIYESEQWPQWWKGVLSVKEIRKGDELGIGSIRTYRLRSPMLYTLQFSLLLTKRIEFKELSGEASGELAGTGAWHFEESAGVTNVECHWNVHTTIKWMNTLAFLLKPVFRFNHGIVMKWGAKSLTKKLGVQVVDIS